MKRKIVAILLCVLIIGTVGISLVACNNNNNNQDKYVGNYVAYVEGQPTIQCYITIQEKQKASEVEGAKDDFYPVAIKTIHPHDIGFHMDSFGWYVGENTISITLSESDTQYIQKGIYTVSSLSDDRFTLSANQDGRQTTIHCKKTNLTLMQWTESAFGSNNEPYYYED